MPRFRTGGYLYQISNSNQLLRTFTMMNHGSVVPSRDIRVTDDGTVYQMIRTEQSTKVYRLEPNPAFRSSPLKYAAPVKRPATAMYGHLGTPPCPPAKRVAGFNPDPGFTSPHLRHDLGKRPFR